MLIGCISPVAPLPIAMMQIDFNGADLEMNRAVKLSVVEVFAGSIGHGLKIPFTGFLLSLNQIYFLANALNKDHLPRRSLVEISGIAAALKSLSIAGQKIGPMVSIFIQGSIFYVVTLILGASLTGQIFAAALAAIWSFFQSLISYILIFGFDYIGMVKFLNDKLIIQNFQIGHYVLTLILISVILKISLAITLVLISYFKKSEIELIKNAYLENFKIHLQLSNSRPSESIWKAAFKDILKPFFLLNLALMGFFIYQVDKSINTTIWITIRSLAIAYLFFFCIRNSYVKKILKAKFGRFYEKVQKAFTQTTKI